MDDMKSGSIFFTNALEAAAYAACVTKMEHSKFRIKQVLTGYELVLEEPISMISHLGIMGGIAVDQKNNPAKWEKTKAALKEKAQKNYEKN